MSYAKNYFLLIISFCIFFFTFIYLCNFYNYFITAFISLLLFLSYYLFIEEFYFNNHLSFIEIIFILFLNVFCVLLTIYLNNIIWVVFLLEIQTFLVFGISALFKGFNYLKTIESSLSYINPAFLSFSLILFSLFFSSLNKDFSLLSNLLVIMALIIKMGAIPYNFWVNQVIKNLTYNSIILLTLLNKLTIIIIFFNYTNNLWFLLVIVGLASIALGCFLIINTYNIKEFIAFSSIINSGWIITVCSFDLKYLGYIDNQELIGFFIISYYLSFLIFINLLEKSFNITEISFSLNFFTNFNLKKFFFNFSLLSLAGIPPLGGFIAKLILLTQITQNYGVIISLMIIISSILTIFSYIRPLIINNNRTNLLLLNPIPIKKQSLFVNSFIGTIVFIILLFTGVYILI